MENSFSISCLGITVWQSSRLITARRKMSSGDSRYPRAVAMPRVGMVFLIRRDFLPILGVGAGHGADGADAHAVEVRAGFGGVSLKIAVERAISLRDGEFVAGHREMVHADVNVSSIEKMFEAGAKDPKFFHALGQVHLKRALLFFEPGNVGVAEHGDAIGRERQSFIDRVRGSSRRSDAAGRRSSRR